MATFNRNAVTSDVSTVAPARAVRNARAARIAFLGCALACFAPAHAADAKKSAEPYVVDACANPIDVHLRIVAKATQLESRYTIGTCGPEGNFANNISGAKSLLIAARNGVADVHLVMHAKDAEADYAIAALEPDGAERPLPHIGQGDGPDVFVRTTRDKRGDYLALHVVNANATQVATDIARAKNLQVDHIERFGKIRVTFLFREVPTRAVLQLLGDVGDVEPRRIGERHYVVAQFHNRAEMSRLWTVVETGDEKAQEVALEALVALAGNAATAADIEGYQFGALEQLAQRAAARKDFDSAAKFYEHWLSVRDVYDAGDHDASYAQTLIALAAVEAHRNNPKHALDLLARAEQIAQSTHFSDEDSAELLPKLADAYAEAGRDDRADALLEEAAEKASIAQQAPILLALAERDIKAARFDAAESELARAYPSLPPKNIDESWRVFSRYLDAQGAVIVHYEEAGLYAKAEPLHERAVEVAARDWGENAPLTADQVYFLAVNLVRQDKDPAAEAQFIRYLKMDEHEPHLGLFRARSIEMLTALHIAKREFREAAEWWQRMADVRLRALGSNDPAVILALQEVAVFEALAADPVRSAGAARKSLQFEQNKNPVAAEPGFLVEADKPLYTGERDISRMLASTSLSTFADEPRDLSDANRVRAEQTAAALEAYVETCVRLKCDQSDVMRTAESALHLRELARGREQPETIRGAKRLIELYESADRHDLATRLRTTYSLD